MVDYEIFRFVSYFFIELSYVYFDTSKSIHLKDPQNSFFYTCSIYVCFDSNECSEETSIKLCYGKRAFLRFCPPAEKAFRLIS
jgi:Ulp1 family protease